MTRTERYCFIGSIVAFILGSVISLCVNDENEVSNSGFDLITFVVLFLN